MKYSISNFHFKEMKEENINLGEIICLMLHSYVTLMAFERRALAEEFLTVVLYQLPFHCGYKAFFPVFGIQLNFFICF